MNSNWTLKFEFYILWYLLCDTHPTIERYTLLKQIFIMQQLWLDRSMAPYRIDLDRWKLSNTVASNMELDAINFHYSTHVDIVDRARMWLNDRRTVRTIYFQFSCPYKKTKPPLPWFHFFKHYHSRIRHDFTFITYFHNLLSQPTLTTFSHTLLSHPTLTTYFRNSSKQIIES